MVKIANDDKKFRESIEEGFKEFIKLSGKWADEEKLTNSLIEKIASYCIATLVEAAPNKHELFVALCKISAGAIDLSRYEDDT